MFSETFIWITVFAVLAAVVNGIGILTIFKRKKWAEKAKTYFMCFAAGMLISTPLILILPTAVQKNFYAGYSALIGFLFIFFSNKLIEHYTKKKKLSFGIVAVEGIGIHSLIDGIIYTVTFSVSIFMGVLAATGLVIHEFAEGVITYLLLVYAFLVAALTTPLGAFVAYPFIKTLGDSHMGLMLGFSAGVIIYISASHLLPESRKDEQKHSTIAFLGGIGLALIIVLTKLL
ncbi:MAG: zinc/iron permease [Candidatus Altiarchaeales archaeon ex4484_2]|nr:MAG: zinc/iron permease [Candidatus Altiarchaeales archaeon ex4484_2]